MRKIKCVDTFLVDRRDFKNDYHAITLAPYPPARQSRPGHFVQVKLPSTDIFFRRPMSIIPDPAGESVEIIFRVFGRGTSLMAKLRKGDAVNVLGPLGVPFTPPNKSRRAVFVAGGVGFPPLLALAERIVAAGHDPKKIEFFYGGRTADDILYRPRIKRLGVNFHPVTEDGSLGVAGLVTDPVTAFLETHSPEKLRLFGCGPQPMLRKTNEIALTYGISGQLSLEAPMPCGIGVCLGCVVPLTAGGHARVCVEGPVFEIGEVEL